MCAYHRDKTSLSHEKARRHALAILGDQCAMCAETDIWVLEIDHISGGGGRHREALGVSSGSSFYYWVIRNAEEADGLLQTICSNCHTRKSRRLAMALWAERGVSIGRS